MQGIEESHSEIQKALIVVGQSWLTVFSVVTQCASVLGYHTSDPPGKVLCQGGRKETLTDWTVDIGRLM